MLQTHNMYVILINVCKVVNSHQATVLTVNVLGVLKFVNNNA
jgi:hypothetical protein